MLREMLSPNDRQRKRAKSKLQEYSHDHPLPQSPFFFFESIIDKSYLSITERTAMRIQSANCRSFLITWSTYQRDGGSCLLIKIRKLFLESPPFVEGLESGKVISLLCCRVDPMLEKSAPVRLVYFSPFEHVTIAFMPPGDKPPKGSKIVSHSPCLYRTESFRKIQPDYFLTPLRYPISLQLQSCWNVELHRRGALGSDV